MVPPDSHTISGVACYLGRVSDRHTLTSTGLSPTLAPLSNGPRPHMHFLTAPTAGRRWKNTPTTPQPQPLPGITRSWFSLIRFRSPLLSESQLFSLPTGTEMFHFPAFPPNTLFHSDAGNRTQLRLGSPIRTPPDQRSVANSPGLIAGSHVLHRLSMPRHPPCALSSLPTQTPHTTQQHPKRTAAQPEHHATHPPDTTQNRPPAQSRRRSDQQHSAHKTIHKQYTYAQKTHSKHYTPTITDLSNGW